MHDYQTLILQPAAICSTPKNGAATVLRTMKGTTMSHNYLPLPNRFAVTTEAGSK